MSMFHSDAEGHEGYVLGFVRAQGGEWHEMGHSTSTPGQRADAIQVACSCGWRSPRLMCWGAKWEPNYIEIDDRDFADTVVGPLWLEHALSPEIGERIGEVLVVGNAWREKHRRAAGGGR